MTLIRETKIQQGQNNDYMGDHVQKQYNNLVASIHKTAYTLNKHDHIRMKHWLEKLALPMTNPVWKQNRNLYLRVLLEMVADGELMKPFNQSPPEGPLPKITLYDIPYPIRIKISDDQHRTEKNTPSSHKTSHHSRKNSSTSNAQYARSKSKGAKNMEHKKHLLFQTQMDNIQNRSQYLKLFNNKSVNLDQSLFSSKNISKQKNSTQKIQINHNYSSEQVSSDKINNKGSQILKKALKLLGKHYDQFQSSITYKKLIQKIVDTGDSIGQNFRDVSVPNVEESAYIDKYNQRIKDKLFQTDLNSMEFMIYLNSVV